MRELLARVNAHLRRVAAFETSEEEIFDDGDLHVDRARFEVRLRGERVHLTKKEFDLLQLLASRSGAVVSREEVMAKVWGDTWNRTGRTIDTHVSSLRGKLGDSCWITTVRGVGFRFTIEQAVVA
jgi:DNA-binding response OmpR family regulator